ncbi:MAG: ATP-binding protein [Bauldia sp.]|nr:ATP-binding protein [Bauldia sp.]
MQVFVSSPIDARFERIRVERVVERLNGEFAGLVTLKALRWEREFYTADKTFQAQIPEAADCEIVIAILRHRLGTPLPDDFPKMSDGEPYPSGTAYEILTAMDAAGKRGLPDLYVFRYPEPPTVRLDDAETNALVTDQWNRLKVFFARWFHTPGGQFKASYHEFANTDDFEAQIEALLRKWVEDKVLGGRAIVWPIETRGSPFRGLAAFGPKHAPVFFGRTRDITRALDALKDAASRGTPFLLLVGASGVGKSSLARAGLVPRLITPGVVAEIDLWRVATMTPTDAAEGPVRALAEALFAARDDAVALPELAAGDYGTPEALAALLGHADETAAKPIVAALDKVGRAEREGGGHNRAVRADIVLLVDQLDELFGAAVTAEERAAFARLLEVLAASGRVWIVATIRADLYERFLGEGSLLALKTRGAAYDLAPPGHAELGEIVRSPAVAADLVFDVDPATGERLDERLLADADRPDMLPLLQFTLDQLFTRREPRNGKVTLTFAAYAALGGIAGAVDRQAEDAVAALSPAEQERLPRLLRQLAEPTRGGAGLTIRAVPLAEAAHDAASAHLVEALVDARILTASGSAGATTVRLAHERVLQNWARARDIVAGNVAFYRIRGNVEDQRRRWEETGRKRDLLIPPGIPLAEAESIAKAHGAELPRDTVAFIAASGRAARQRQRLLVAATIVFAVIAAIAGWQTIQAYERRAEAVAERERAEQETARAEAERARAEQSLTAAKIALNSVTFDVAVGMRGIAGMQVGTLRSILDGLGDSIESLSAAAPGDLDLMLLKATVLAEFALTYFAQGDIISAIAAAEAGVAAARELAAAAPDDPQYRRNVAVSLQRLAGVQLNSGNAPATADGIVESIAIMRSLVAAEPEIATYGADLLGALDIYGTYQLLVGDFAGAGASFDESLAIGRDLVEREPENTDFLRSLSVALNKSGDVLWRMGDAAGAEVVYLEGLAVARDLAARNPANDLWQTDVATQLDNLGIVRAVLGNLDGAVEVAGESLEIARELGRRDPGNLDRQRSISVALDRLGGAYNAQGNYQNARPLLEEGLVIARAVAEADPANPERQRDLSVLLNSLGDLLNAIGERTAAFALYDEGLGIARRLAALDPANLTWQLDVVISLYQVWLTTDDPDRERFLDEGIATLEGLDEAGLLTDETRAWTGLLGQLRDQTALVQDLLAPAEEP